MTSTRRSYSTTVPLSSRSNACPHAHAIARCSQGLISARGIPPMSSTLLAGAYLTESLAAMLLNGALCLLEIRKLTKTSYGNLDGQYQCDFAPDQA